MQDFPHHYEAILGRMKAVQPQAYARTRNFTNGAVTRLSPYLSRGVISTRMVMNHLAENHSFASCEKLLQELAWRDYYQRVWQHLDEEMNKDIKRPQEHVFTRQLPAALSEASTGIAAIDAAISELFQSGYMHNHCRMYTAAVACHVAKAHWLQPARWMYYHLLDGDWASNALSWQWVAGTFSNKIYVANQENINTYTGSTQKDSFLDRPYSELPPREIPASLLQSQDFDPENPLPSECSILNLEPGLPVMVYNYYNMDPAWHADIKANRVLLLEPELFQRYPVSDNCIRFLLQLGKNIPGLQVFYGSFSQLQQAAATNHIHYKEHPLNRHYTGHSEERDWMVPEVQGYHPSFFAYWKKIQPCIRRNFSS